ncbi:hypothetical protein YPPY94_0437, partial [Yersinia pestis PY-94]
MLRRVSTS